LGIRDDNLLAQTLGKILKQTHSRGELFTLQIHPERIPFLSKALQSVLHFAHVSNPKIWLTSLNSIYEWWKEKDTFRLKLNNTGNDEYEIHVDCTPRGTLMVKSKDLKEYQFLNGYRRIKDKVFRIKSPKRPIIGIQKESAPGLIQFLKNEGFIFELSEEKEKYSHYLDTAAGFSEKDEMQILKAIHNNDSPLIRFWRWPDGCQSALTVTGDIDAITIFDFFERLKIITKQNRKNLF